MRIRIGLLAIILFTLAACHLPAVRHAAADTGKERLDRVDVYYFHGNFRCASCHRIELYTEGALDEFFSKELQSGELVYKVVNVDQKQNAHFVKDYQLYTRSVIVSLVKDGKEVEYKNLRKVWEYLGNKRRFYDYVKNAANNFLCEL